MRRAGCAGEGGARHHPRGPASPLAAETCDALTEMPQEEGDLSGARGGDLGHSLRGGAMQAEP